MSDTVTKVQNGRKKIFNGVKNLITGEDPSADRQREKEAAAAKLIQDKLDLQLSQDEDAVKARQAKRDSEMRSIRLGRSGKRSLLTGSFAGVPTKRTLG